MKPKDLLTAVREKHPEVRKKEVVRAAFYALIEQPAIDPDQMRDLHHFALNERVSDEEGDRPVARLPRKKKPRKDVPVEQATH